MHEHQSNHAVLPPSKTQTGGKMKITFMARQLNEMMLHNRVRLVRNGNQNRQITGHP